MASGAYCFGFDINLFCPKKSSLILINISLSNKLGECYRDITKKCHVVLGATGM